MDIRSLWKTYTPIIKQKTQQASNFLLNSPKLNFVDRANDFIMSNKNLTIPEVQYNQKFKDAPVVNTLKAGYKNLVRPVVNSGLRLSADTGIDIGKMASRPGQIQYNQLKSPISRLMAQAIDRDSVMGTPRRTQDVISNVGQIGEDIINLYTPKAVGGLVTQTGKQGIKRLAIQGAKQSAKLGFTGGLSSGVQGDFDSVGQQIGSGLKSAAIGTGAGATIGAGIPVAGAGAKIAGKLAKSGVRNTLSDLSAPGLLNKPFQDKITAPDGGITYRKDLKTVTVPLSKLRSWLRGDKTLVSDYSAPDIDASVVSGSRGYESILVDDPAGQEYVRSFSMKPGFAKVPQKGDLSPLSNEAKQNIFKVRDTVDINSLSKDQKAVDYYKAQGYTGIENSKGRINFDKTPTSINANQIKSEINKVDKELKRIADRGDKFTSKAKITSQSAKDQNKVELLLQRKDELSKALSTQPLKTGEVPFNETALDVAKRRLAAKTETAPNIKPETTPKTNIGLRVKSPELSVSNSKTDLPTSQSSSAGMETPQPQLKSNKKLSFDETIPKDNTFYNVDRLNISDKAKKTVKTEIAKSGEKISEVTGRTLTNEEVIKTAENTAGILDRTVGRAQTEKKIAANLKLRQKVAAVAQKGFQTKKEAEDFIGLWLKDKSAGTDIARQLQARRIQANQNEQEGIDIILNAIYKSNKNADEIMAASKNYDLSNPEQLTKFYREFVKPNFMDWVDVIRYNSMLSSPTTHLVNISSNIQGAGVVEPLTKTVTGGLDAIRSALTGTPRQAFAGEGLEYSKGAISNLGNASRKLWNVMSGKDNSFMQEIHNIPLTEKGTGRRVAENVLKLPGRLLQGMDEFFTSLGEAGNLRSLTYRESKGVKVSNMGQQAYAQAKKTIFNAPFDPKEEGKVLEAIEFIPKLLAGWKNNENEIIRTVAKFTFPFVKIGSNLLKSGVEYSPTGIGTLWGATNKTEQLAKTIIGTASALGAATLLGQDRLTWAEPINEKQKNAFRDAGLQPYSVKVGNTWISYSKLHPALAFNFALISALDDSIKNQRLSDDQAETVLNTFVKFGKFVADASYLRNIGDFVSASQGSVSGWSKYASNYGQQLIPLRALMGWVERIVDPVQRQVDADGSILEKQMQYVMAQIPWVANKVPVRTNEMGDPIINQNRSINAISPARVTTENPQGMETYNRIMAESAANKQTEDINKANKKGLQLDPSKTGEISPGIYRLKDGTIKYKKEDGQLEKVSTVEKAQEKLFTIDFKNSDRKKEVYGDKTYLKADNEQGYKAEKTVDYDYSVAKSNIDRRIEQADKDKPASLKLYEEKAKLIEEYSKTLDPEIDIEKINTLNNEIENLNEKYASTQKSIGSAANTARKKVKTQKEAEYSLNVDKYKRANDLKGYLKATQSQIDYLTDYANNTSDEVEQLRIENRIGDLMAQATKYQEQGGFNKIVYKPIKFQSISNSISSTPKFTYKVKAPTKYAIKGKVKKPLTT